MKIAVLGLGRMGRALASRLLEGDHEMVLWNRTPGKAPDLVERGASEAATVGEAVEGVDLVLTMLSNDEAVRSVALDAGGIRDRLGEASAYADCSTVSPALTRELAAGFRRYVAMPILGSPSQVAAGKAMYLIGARESAAAAVGPLFPHLSEKTFRYEEPPEAAAAKVAVNLLLLNGVVSLAESFAVGRAGGLSDDQLRDLLGQSPMVAPGLGYRFEGILTGGQETIWTMVLGAKDAGLAVELASSAGIDLPVTSVARQLYREAAADHAGSDIALVAERYRRRSG